MEEKEKRVDESWKDSVEKDRIEQPGAEEHAVPEPDFKFFITTLSLQAAIALGQIPNPVTDKKEENLPQAKFLIDTLDMLKEKTEGNLNQEEGEFLEDVLYNLRMQYISMNQGGSDGRQGTS